MIPNIGPMELVVVLVLALLVLGPKRLPGAARSVGQGMHELKEAVTGRGSRSHDDDAPAISVPADSARHEPHQAV